MFLSMREPKCSCPIGPPPARPVAAVILFAMGFGSRGFTWAHVALFSAMVASTDALSVTAILKKSGSQWDGAGGGAFPAVCNTPTRVQIQQCLHCACSSARLMPCARWVCSPRVERLSCRHHRCHCAAGGPERLVTLMEGESLLNDASGEVADVWSCSIMVRLPSRAARRCCWRLRHCRPLSTWLRGLPFYLPRPYAGCKPLHIQVSPSCRPRLPPAS